MQPVVGKEGGEHNRQLDSWTLRVIRSPGDAGVASMGSNPVYKSDPAKSQAHRVEGNVTTAVLIY